MLALLATKNVDWYGKDNIDGSIEYIFYLDIIALLDKVFILGDNNVLDKEQKEFVMEYLTVADTPDLLDDISEQFDIYLGSYLGVRDDVYKESKLHKGLCKGVRCHL